MIATVTREQVQGLHVGQTRVEVEQRLGRPVRTDGGGLTVLVYRLDNAHDVRIAFGPGLLWAREMLDGAERDLVRGHPTTRRR